VHVVAAATNMSALVLTSAEALTALKLIGAAYLKWIGVRTILVARHDARAIAEGLTPTPPLGPRRAFREGVVVEALNPKTAAFFLAFLPQFLDVSGLM
jgi:threonine/homoserine/homoserine lactone efflux protein